MVGGGKVGLEGQGRSKSRASIALTTFVLFCCCYVSSFTCIIGLLSFLLGGSTQSYRYHPFSALPATPATLLYQSCESPDICSAIFCKNILWSLWHPLKYSLGARDSIGVFEGRGVGGLGPTLVSCPCASAEWSRYNSPLCSMLPVLKLSFCIWTLELTLKIICCWYEFTTIAQNTLIHDHYCGNNATQAFF